MDATSLSLTPAGHYDAGYFSWQSQIGRFGGWANLSKFQEFVPPDAAVLDYGCGGGYLLAHLACRARAGIDVNPVARRTAEKFGIPTYANAGEVADAWADVIISNNALEHTQYPFQELQGLWPKLKPGGIIVFVVPCESIRYAWQPGDINRHLYSWSPMCLGNLFTEAGFSVLECKPYIHKWPPHYRALARLLGRRLFDLVCRIYGRIERSWFQVRVVARRPGGVEGGARSVERDRRRRGPPEKEKEDD